MGWSCAREAAFTLDAFDKACRESTGSSNSWRADGKSYFYETSRTEHDDGAITGKVWQVKPWTDPKDGSVSDRCFPAGSFRIEPDGNVSRAPKFLKDAAKMHRPGVVAAYFGDRASATPIGGVK